MAGTAIVVIAGSAGPSGDPAGMAMAVASVVLLSVFFVLSKMSRVDIDVLPFLFGVTVVGAAAVTLANVALGEQLVAPSGSNLLLVFVVALLPGGVGHFVSMWPLRWIPANLPPLLQLAIPAVAALLAWWFLGEVIRLQHVFGGVLTLVGVGGAVLWPSGRRFATASQPDRGEHDRPPRR